MNLNGEMYDVVGVMPKEFNFPGRTDLWRPLACLRRISGNAARHYLRAVGKLKDGVTVQGAMTDLNTIAKRLQQDHPGSNHGWDTTLMDLQDAAVGRVRPAMLTLLAAVGFVLLIACTSIWPICFRDRHRVRKRSESARRPGRG